MTNTEKDAQGQKLSKAWSEYCNNGIIIYVYRPNWNTHLTS